MTESDPSKQAKLSANVDPVGISEQPLRCDVSPQDVFRMMDGYFDRVDSPQRQTLSSHLDSCDCCTDVYQFQMGLRSVIGTGCREDLPPEVRQRVLDSLNRLL